MAFSAWPTGDEIEAQVVATGVASSITDNDHYSLLAKREAIIRTGWNPFLTESAAAYEYDPPVETSGGARVLFLKRGLLNCTSVKINWDGSAGDTITLRTDYRLVGGTGADWSPYTRIEFFGFVGTQPSSVRVLGDWGFGSNIPDDLWMAAKGYGAAMAIVDLRGDHGAVVSEKKGPVELKYGDSSSSLSSVDRLIKNFNDACERYRMVSL